MALQTENMGRNGDTDPINSKIWDLDRIREHSDFLDEQIGNLSIFEFGQYVLPHAYNRDALQIIANVIRWPGGYLLKIDTNFSAKGEWFFVPNAEKNKKKAGENREK